MSPRPAAPAFKLQHGAVKLRHVATCSGGGSTIDPSKPICQAMATVTKTTVEVTVGQYHYRADLDGNAVELFRDGASAGHATWTGEKIEGFPKVLSEDAHDALNAAIVNNLQKAWRARPETFGEEVGPEGDPVLGNGAPKTQDAANQGQMGNEVGKPSRQGEAEVGKGGPGHDPNSDELGGQAVKPHRRAVGDGFRKP